MENLRQYIMSVILAALICGILLGLVHSKSSEKAIRLLCGLFLTLTVIRFPGQIELDSLFSSYSSYNQTAQDAAALGKKRASKMAADSIKAQYETYILDKASALNAEVSIDISVNQEYIPIHANISGKISPYNRHRLEDILETDLGITKENQLWTG